MSARDAVSLTPSVYLRLSKLTCHEFRRQGNFHTPYTLPSSVSRNSFACHPSENSPISPAIATDPITHVSNPFICHTSEIPPVVTQRSSMLQTFQRVSTYPIFFQALAQLFCIFLHSFPSAQNSTLFFSSVSALFAKNTGGAGIFHLEARSVPIPYPLSPPMLLYIVTSLLLFFSHEREL
jgi:hypothetical protein